MTVPEPLTQVEGTGSEPQKFHPGSNSFEGRISSLSNSWGKQGQGELRGSRQAHSGPWKVGARLARRILLMGANRWRRAPDMRLSEGRIPFQATERGFPTPKAHGDQGGLCQRSRNV